MASFKQYSRYTDGTVLTDRENHKYLQLRKTLSIPTDPSDIYVTITQQFVNRIDLLSNYLYGIPDLWWVICDYNNIQDPIKGLYSGLVIVAPTLDRLLPYITT